MEELKDYTKHPTIMKLDTVIPYLKRIQKIFKSNNTDKNCMLIYLFFLILLTLLTH